MRILITNDDGIHAPGLAVLEDIARQLSSDVWIVAPEMDQSGVSHSVSLNDPLRMRHVSERRYAVRGTPSDCVILGLHHILEGRKPDVLLSGVNRGHNVAEDVTYSGTIAGAMEGTLLGLPSIALSQSYNRNSPAYDRMFACAAAHGAAVVDQVLEAGIPAGVLINVNFPACGPDQVQGLLATRQGTRSQGFLSIEAREDGRRNPYYWVVYGHPDGECGEDTDLAALAQNMVSVTPLKINLTDETYRAHLAAVFKGA